MKLHDDYRLEDLTRDALQRARYAPERRSATWVGLLLSLLPPLLLAASAWLALH